MVNTNIHNDKLVLQQCQSAHQRYTQYNANLLNIHYDIQNVNNANLLIMDKHNGDDTFNDIHKDIHNDVHDDIYNTHRASLVSVNANLLLKDIHNDIQNDIHNAMPTCSLRINTKKCQPALHEIYIDNGKNSNTNLIIKDMHNGIHNGNNHNANLLIKYIPQCQLAHQRYRQWVIKVEEEKKCNSNSSSLVQFLQSGTTRVEWPLTSIQRVCVATGGEIEDEGKIFIIQTRASHPCGEAFLYFFSPELSELLEGLHEAVSDLITATTTDDSSLISDLSELSGALNSVVVLPTRLPEPPKSRRATSVLDLQHIHELQSLCNIHTPPRLSSSQCNLAEEMRLDVPLPGGLGHSRRRSMSETNLSKLCFDETDEELDSRDDDLDEGDLRQDNVPKDRTSSSGSYNSYRSTDSGVRLSASPSTYGDAGRYMTDHGSRRFVSKSDSIDSGVKTCLKEDIRDSMADCEESKKGESLCPDTKVRGMGALEEEPDIDSRVGAWCLQSARARKSFFTKNLNVSCATKDRKVRTLNRTMSESYKEVVDKDKEDYKKKLDYPIAPKATTVYEEICDVLKPLSRKDSKEHDYEELEKCRRDIKRSYSFQEKTQPPPPLPPRRPKSFSPDPWVEGSLTRSGTIKKFFGLSFQSKSHSTESMLDLDNSGLDDVASLGSVDMATVQALGTLPRVKKKTFEARKSSSNKSSRAGSPKMSPKQKARALFGASPSRSPLIPRPKNLFLFRTPSKDELQPSPSKPPFRLHRQFSLQGQRTSSTDSSIADPSTPETPQSLQSCSHRTQWRSEASTKADILEKDFGERISGKDAQCLLKSPKLISKTFSFLKKFPKEKSGSLERKRKSGINFVPPPVEVSPNSTKFPNSYSMDSFAVEKGSQSCGTPSGDGDSEWRDSDMVPPTGRLRSMSYLPPTSPAIRIPFRSNHESEQGTPTAGTPTGLSYSPFRTAPSPQPPTEVASWQDEGDLWNESEGARRITTTGLPPPPNQPPPPLPQPHEPHYANIPHHDSEYMSMEEVQGAFRRISSASASEVRRDSGGYLSMGEIKSYKREYDKSDCPGCKIPGSVGQTEGNTQTEISEVDHEYMTMEDIQTVLHSEFPGICEPPFDTEIIKQGYKSAPASRKTSYTEGSEYLTPQEVGRMIKREMVPVRRGRSPSQDHSSQHSHQKYQAQHHKHTPDHHHKHYHQH
ncbi:unnamed protein product, partial [Meganyctiphanes norvegica]